MYSPKWKGCGSHCVGRWKPGRVIVHIASECGSLVPCVETLVSLSSPVPGWVRGYLSSSYSHFAFQRAFDAIESAQSSRYQQKLMKQPSLRLHRPQVPSWPQILQGFWEGNCHFKNPSKKKISSNSLCCFSLCFPFGLLVLSLGFATLHTLGLCCCSM